MSVCCLLISRYLQVWSSTVPFIHSRFGSSALMNLQRSSEEDRFSRISPSVQLPNLHRVAASQSPTRDRCRHRYAGAYFAFAAFTACANSEAKSPRRTAIVRNSSLGTMAEYPCDHVHASHVRYGGRSTFTLCMSPMLKV